MTAYLTPRQALAELDLFARRSPNGAPMLPNLNAEVLRGILDRVCPVDPPSFGMPMSPVPRLPSPGETSLDNLCAALESYAEYQTPAHRDYLKGLAHLARVQLRKPQPVEGPALPPGCFVLHADDVGAVHGWLIEFRRLAVEGEAGNMMQDEEFEAVSGLIDKLAKALPLPPKPLEPNPQHITLAPEQWRKDAAAYAEWLRVVGERIA